jgi:hypothetical protein
MTQKNWLPPKNNFTVAQNKFGHSLKNFNHMIGNGSISTIDLVPNLGFFLVIIRLQ